MKILKRAIILAVLSCYLAATIVNSNLWGDILSPIVVFGTIAVVFNSFVLKQKKGFNRFIGVLLSLSLLAWVLADLLWAVYDLVYHVNPDEIDVITYLYALTNVFLTLALAIYGLQLFRKWNIVQMLLDSLVMSFLVMGLVWIAFLGEDVKNILLLRSDWISTSSIVMDVVIAMLIVIGFISVRIGRFPRYVQLITIGALLYSITDLIYFYEYFFRTYEPNSILDAIYVLSFLIFAMAAKQRLHDQNNNEEAILYNIGRKGKGFYLLAVPLLIIIFRGFEINILLHFLLIILFYITLTAYIQNNIYKESMLRKEQELNGVLENKVKARTEELEVKNKALEKLINQDIVTGLYNRRYLLSYLEEEIGKLKQEDTIVLLYIDVNRFKMISTMFGHYIREKILHEIAIRLKPFDNIETSLLAHYSDDSYIIAITGKYDYEHGHEFAKEVIRLCSDIYQIDEYQIRITVNVGISVYPYDALTKEELIKHADLAMTQARVKGFNMIGEFDLQLSEIFFRRSNIELMLKKVNFNHDFTVYYQPELQTETKKIIGFEALLRWNTAEGDAIGPAEFIPIAEETGYIIPIGNWVIENVLKQLIDWNNRFKEKIMIGINISLKQLNSAKLLDKLKEEINLLQIKPEWLDLEITESLQLQENPDVLKLIEEIRSMGIRISIDDFGTGYSSLSYFKNLPVDRIKLAKELIDFIHTDDFDYELVKSIIMLSRARGIKVIAEGVESKEQWEALKNLQCDEVQGFYFGRPVSAQEIEELYGEILLDEKRN